MSSVEVEARMAAADQEKGPERLAPLWPPVGIAVLAVVLLLAVIVSASRAAWMLLGAGRGLVPEAYYPVSGFVLVLATTSGQAAGWAGGSALLYHVMTLVGFRTGWPTARLAMSVVYVGLAGLPVSVYHLLYGQWLLGLPRVGLEEWLLRQHPDAYWLLITAHPAVDLSLIPLAVVFLGLLWRSGDRLRHSLALQTVLWLVLLGTSLAVALSLGIHSTLVHVRLGPLLS